MDLDDLFRRADPAREHLSPEGTSAMAQWTYAQITRADVRTKRFYARPRLVLVAAMALGLALVIGNVVIGPPPPHTSAGSAALRHAAIVVAEQSVPPIGPGQYLYTQTKSLVQVTIYQRRRNSKTLVTRAYAQYVETEQSWANINGTGRGLLTRGPLQFTSQAEQSAWNATAAGQNFSSLFSRSVEEPSLQQLVPDLADLSTNPNMLAHEVAEAADGTNVDLIPAGPSAVFQRAARLLVGPDSGMTPSLASALYRVMADQSGITLLGTTNDHSGRRGVGISTSGPSGVSELIIDPESGSALEAQYAPPASVISSPSGGRTIRCLTETKCGSSVEQSPSQNVAVVVAPIWTDTVTMGIVNSDAATEQTGAANV